MAKRKKLSKRQRGQIKRRVVLVLGLLMAVGLVGAILYHPAPQTRPETSNFTLDSRLSALADEVGINKQDLIDAKTNFSLTAGCIAAKAFGCYSGGVIYINEDILVNHDLAKVTLTHEYMTYVRNHKLSTEERVASNMLVRDFYYRNSQVVDRALANEPGSKDINSDFYLDNVESVACSETSNESLGAQLTAYCNKWVNTNALPDYIK